MRISAYAVVAAISAFILEETQFGDHGIAKGYAPASSSLNSFGTNCADVISVETMMMVKEHFIEAFGAPRYTIGSGRSGGSMQQHLIANNYPGCSTVSSRRPRSPTRSRS